MAALTWEDFDRTDPFRVDVRVRNENARKIRRITLPAEAAAALGAYEKERKEKGFPSSEAVLPINRTYLSEVVAGVAHEAEVKKSATPQTLRHYAAVRMLKAGKTLQEVHRSLGLADPKDSVLTAQMYQRLAQVAGE